MQNLPLIVTQNTLPKNPVAANNQKTADSGNSFQQILSRQVGQEAPKDSVVQPVKSKANQAQADQAQPEQVDKSSDKGQVAAEQGVNAVTADVAGKEIDMTGFILPALDLKSGKLKDSKASVDAPSDKTTATPGLQDASPDMAAIGLLQAPVMPVVADAKPLKEAFASVDMQKRQQLDTNLSAALAQDKKAEPLDKGALDMTQAPLDAKTGNWLDNVMPKSGKSMESGELIGGSLASKLIQETSVKSMQDSQVPLTVAPVSTVVNQAATQVSSAQGQLGVANTIGAYPGKTGWDQAISQKVVWMVGAAEQSATLTLNPPDLGPLQVVISVNNDKVDTTFISENPEVRKALEDGMSNLRNSMDQAGIQLGQANVNTSGQQQEYQQAAKARESQQAVGSISSASSEKPVISRTIARINDGLVDTFA